MIKIRNKKLQEKITFVMDENLVEEIEKLIAFGKENGNYRFLNFSHFFRSSLLNFQSEGSNFNKLENCPNNYGRRVDKVCWIDEKTKDLYDSISRRGKSNVFKKIIWNYYKKNK